MSFEGFMSLISFEESLSWKSFEKLMSLISFRIYESHKLNAFWHPKVICLYKCLLTFLRWFCQVNVYVHPKICVTPKCQKMFFCVTSFISSFASSIFTCHEWFSSSRTSSLSGPSWGTPYGWGDYYRRGRRGE